MDEARRTALREAVNTHAVRHGEPQTADAVAAAAEVYHRFLTGQTTPAVKASVPAPTNANAIVRARKKRRIKNP
jgi:hypothetical protein